MNKVQAAKTIIKLAKALATDSSSSRTAGAKYTLTDEKIHLNGYILHRVKYADGKLGGFIESEKNLQGNAKVLNNSMVWGKAVVKDNAIVDCYSNIYDDSIISGHAIVRKGASICNSKVSDNAIVENSWVMDNASVSKRAKVINNSHIENNATVTDQAIVNNSFVDSKAKVFGKAKVSNNSYISGSSQVSGIVDDSGICAKSIIKGEVKHCLLVHQVVEKNESLENQNDY